MSVSKFSHRYQTLRTEGRKLSLMVSGFCAIFIINLGSCTLDNDKNKFLLPYVQIFSGVFHRVMVTVDIILSNCMQMNW